MPESQFLSRPFKTRQRYVSSLMEPWKKDHEDAMFARDVEESVRVCLTMPDLIRNYLARLWRLAFAGELDFEQARQETLDNFQITAEVFRGVGDSIAAARAKGHVIADAERLLEAEVPILTLKEDFLARWPQIDEKLIEAADAAIQRGDTQSVEDILGELQGTDSQAHQG